VETNLKLFKKKTLNEKIGRIKINMTGKYIY